MAKMTAEQKDLARAALGLRHRRQSYRNRYVSLPAGDTFAHWQAMVAAGLAEQHPSTRADGTPLYAAVGVLFALTLAGAVAALEPGEFLDPEEFPEDDHG